MAILDYLRLVREQWAVIALSVALGMVSAAAVWVMTPATYTASLTMYVSAQARDTNGSAYDAGLLSQQRVTSYVELVGSPRVAAEVVRRLGLDEDPGEVADAISASASPQSVLIHVTVTGTSPDGVTEIANAVGGVVGDVVDQLERPTTSTGTAPVAIRVVEPAAVPGAPSSTGLPTALVFGLLAGLVIGVGGAFARNALDISVRSPERLRWAAGAPLLGSIPFDPDVQTRPLTVREAPQSPQAEAFRRLRTTIQLADLEGSHRVIVMTSALPGEGSTTTLCNLAIALAATGNRVAVVGADLRRDRLAELLDLPAEVGLTNVLAGEVPLPGALQPWSVGLDVLTAGPQPPGPSELIASRTMRKVLSDLRSSHDVVLVDAPPVLSVADAAAIAPWTDGVVLVCRYQRTTTKQVASAARVLASVTADIIGTVFTMIPRRAPDAYAQYIGSPQRRGRRTEQAPAPALWRAPAAVGVAGQGDRAPRHRRPSPFSS